MEENVTIDHVSICTRWYNSTAYHIYLVDDISDGVIKLIITASYISKSTNFNRAMKTVVGIHIPREIIKKLGVKYKKFFASNETVVSVKIYNSHGYDQNLMEFFTPGSVLYEQTITKKWVDKLVMKPAVHKTLPVISINDHGHKFRIIISNGVMTPVKHVGNLTIDTQWFNNVITKENRDIITDLFIESASLEKCIARPIRSMYDEVIDVERYNNHVNTLNALRGL